MSDWKELWAAYASSLESWNHALAELKEADTKLHATFAEVLAKAAGTDAATVEKFGKNWKAAVDSAGLPSGGLDGYLGAAAQDGSLGRLEEWQSRFSGEGIGQIAGYGSSMKKFAETWDSMWPQK